MKMVEEKIKNKVEKSKNYLAKLNHIMQYHRYDVVVWIQLVKVKALNVEKACVVD